MSMPFGGTMSCDDYDTGTAAAAAGGTTCIVDFAIQTDGSLLQGLRTWQERAEGAAHIDYGFHLAITDASASALGEMEQAVAEGVSTFKCFMAYKGQMMVTDEELLSVLEQTGRTGGLVLVHCENGDAVVHLQETALARGDVAPRFHAETRPSWLEGEATGRALRLAASVGRPLFVVHVTCEEALREVQAARDRGEPAYGETCVQDLVLTVDDLARPGFQGAQFVCSPPLREQRHQDILWAGLRQGALQAVTTDHCPFTLEQKALGEGDFTKIPNGMPSIEHRLSVLWDRGVRTGRMTPNELVRQTATEPARIFGLAPRKGSIAPGGDADLVIFDPEAQHTISAATHVTASDYDPFEGWTVTGTPRTVLSRGEVVVEGGAVVSTPGRGRYVRRTLFEEAA
jgi:dihydropyrimidinase